MSPADRPDDTRPPNAAGESHAAALPPLMPNTLQWLPAHGQPQQLMVLLHAGGAGAQAMAPLAQVLRRQFEQAAVLAPENFDLADDSGLPAVLPRLADWVKKAQQASGVGAQATAMVGFSHGATLALMLAQVHDGLAGRVLAFAGSYATLPKHAPQETTLHFFNGADDPRVPAQKLRETMQRLSELHADATIDIAKGVGHELAPVLMRLALQRLTSHIPHRTWQAAMGQLPPAARRAAGGAAGELDD